MKFNKKCIRFIINPISGTRDKYYIESFIINYIDHKNISYDMFFSEYPGHASKLASEAAQKEYDAVIAIGGDGTINDVAKGLLGTNTALGFIPNGSGNGLARYLKIPLSIKNAIDVINKFHVVAIDTAEINKHFFVSLAGLGFDAKVADDFAKTKKRGFFSYFKIIINKFFKYTAKDYTITYDGKTIFRKAMMITFANSNQFGYNTVIAPEAKINDGLLDVCIIEKIPLINAPVLSILLFLKRINVSKHFEIIKTNEITVSQNKKRVAHIDGDPIVLGKKIHVKVLPASLKVIANPKKIM